MTHSAKMGEISANEYLRWEEVQPEKHEYFYPDLMVTCDPSDNAAEIYLSSPVLVVEVLSPSTEAYDRGEKFAAYRLIPTLQEYVLIDPDTRRIEIYRLDTNGRWYLSEPDAAGDFRLESIGLTVSLNRVFENV